jgi:hypothetical protein
MSYCHIASCIAEVTTTNGCTGFCHISLWVSEVNATNWDTSYCHIASCITEVTTTNWDTSYCHIASCITEVTTTYWDTSYCHIASCITEVTTTYWDTSYCHLCSMCYKVTTRNWGTRYFHSTVTSVLPKGWITKILCLAETINCLHVHYCVLLYEGYQSTAGSTPPLSRISLLCLLSTKTACASCVMHRQQVIVRRLAVLVFV